MAAGSRVRSAVSRSRSPGVLEERVHPAGDQVAGRVAAGVDEQDEEEAEVGLVEPVPVHLGARERGSEVVCGTGALGVPDAGGVAEHLQDGGQPRALGLARGIGVDRLGQPVQLDPVLRGMPSISAMT